MQTEELIARLAAELKPVRRLASPARRLAVWLAVSVPAAVIVALAFGVRPDLATRLADPGFVLGLAGALLTALAAAYAAFCAGLPDEPVWKIWLPAAPLALWLATLGRQCLDILISIGPNGLTVTNDAMCLPAIAVGGLVPVLAIVVMLRQSRAFRTTHACFCGALASAALGAAALRLYHPVDAAIMVIVWQLGSVAILTFIAGAVARLMFRPSSRSPADGAA